MNLVSRGIVAMLVPLSLCLATRSGISQETTDKTKPLIRTVKHYVKYHRYMETTATLFHDGKAVFETKSASSKHLFGLRNQTLFVVASDAASNAIWVSKVHKCSTVGGLPPFERGEVSHVDTVSEKWPDEIGANTVELFVFHSAGDLHADREKMVEEVKATAKDLSEVVKVVVATLK